MKAGKTCYYEVLGVGPKAPLEEIKASYRKLVLQLHPDKNKDPEAKPKFLAVQEAWEILSDVNERTWYDNNRESVLYNKDDLREEDYDMLAFGFNIWKLFSPACYSGFGDDEAGFFAVYRKAFQLLKAEEQRAFEREEQDHDFRKLCGFGDNGTSQDLVEQFYRQW